MKKSVRMENKQLDFKAAITEEQLYEGETNMKSFEVPRKIAMATLARSRAQMVEGFKDDFGLLAECIEAVTAYKDHLEKMIELAGCAQARLFSVGRMVISNYDFKEGQQVVGK